MDGWMDRLVLISTLYSTLNVDNSIDTKRLVRI